MEHTVIFCLQFSSGRHLAVNTVTLFRTAVLVVEGPSSTYFIDVLFSVVVVEGPSSTYITDVLFAVVVVEGCGGTYCGDALFAVLVVEGINPFTAPSPQNLRAEKMHAHACEKYIFRSYNKSDFNTVRFMKIHLHANVKRKTKIV